MQCRKLIVWGGLICCSVLQAEASSGSEPAMSAEARMPAKRSIQAVTRADGSVVDRLTLPTSAKSASAKSISSQAGLPASPEAWLARMMDPTKNGLAVKNPELFAEWLDAVTEPRFMTALASVAIAPGTYTNTLGKAVDPATVRNWAEFADPQIGLRWMAAGFDPHFYQAIFNRLTDSGKLRRWGLYPASLVNESLSADRETPDARSQLWLQLPSRETRANPWLINSVNYRY